MEKITFDEICTNGELERYRKELQIAVELAENNGFTVATRYDCPQSSTDWKFKCIRLALGGGVLKGLPVFWDLLHEIGHVLDGDPGTSLPLDEAIPREKSAWSNVWMLVKEHFPRLIGFQTEFRTHQDKSFSTYLHACKAKERNTKAV